MPRQPGQHSRTHLQAVVFDAFGTLVQITDKRAPFHRLLELAGATVSESHAFAAAVMTSCHNLYSAAALYCPGVSRDDLDILQDELQRELDSMRLFPEVHEVLWELKNKGLKIGICSNLAAPYAELTRLLVPHEVDAFSWSFEVGALKPSQAIYNHACQALGCHPGSVLMVGDKEDEDFLGPLRVGMQAMRLRRNASQPGRASIQSLIPLLTEL
jgi:HAD superfamily hydrolase (TIGR01493 family)